MIRLFIAALLITIGGVCIASSIYIEGMGYQGYFSGIGLIGFAIYVMANYEKPLMIEERVEVATAGLESIIHTIVIDLDLDERHCQNYSSLIGGISCAISDLKKEIKHKQSVIDALMFEYCPDEMAEEQTNEWEKNQRIVPEKAND